MNHDITDEVMLGVDLVTVRVLKQGVFVTGKRSDHSRWQGQCDNIYGAVIEVSMCFWAIFLGGNKIQL